MVRTYPRMIGALLLAALLLGCGKKETEVTSTPGGDAPAASTEFSGTVDGDGAAASSGESQLKELKMKEGIDLSKFGVAQYPGAKPYADDSFSSMEYSTTEGSGASAMFVTDDPPAKVIGFYEGELTDVTKVSMGEGGSVTGKTPNGNVLIVTVTTDEGKTRVSLSLLPSN